MSEYISVKEFATRVGVSPQAVYQRIDKDLKPFLKLIESKKMLNIKGIELFELKSVEQAIEQDFNNNLLKSLQDILATLSAQLDAKDKQIADLNERLKEAQELNRNNQILLGSEQTRTNSNLLSVDGGGVQGVAEPYIGWFARVFGRKK